MKNFSLNQEVLNQTELHKLRNLIDRWSKCFPKENTWVNQNYGVPSFIVCTDCTINNRGVLSILEIDEAPRDTDLLEYDSTFINAWNKCRQYWPKFKLVSQREANHFLETLSVREAKATNQLILLESTKNISDLESLQHRSVSTCLERGDRSYGLSLDLWEELDSSVLEKGSRLDLEESFCLKSQTRITQTGLLSPNGTAVWIPKRMRRKESNKNGGITTKSKILKIIEEERDLYIQDYIEPMRFRLPTDKTNMDMIYRVFFLFNVKKRCYEYAGGIWLADNKHQSLFGCIVYEPVTSMAEFMS